MFEPVGKTKVCYYHVPMPIKEEIFEFQVAVDNLFLVDVPDARDELTEEFARIFLLQVAVSENVVKKFTTGRVFEDDANILVRLDDVVQPNDVRMFESLGAESERKNGRKDVRGGS
jgi:hypothetical protein